MKRSCILAASLFGSIFVGGLEAQQAGPQFEVASLKPSTSGLNGVRGGCRGIDSRDSIDGASVPLGRCVITDGRLSHMISIAWGMPVGSIHGAPDWVIGGAERFTIMAKAADSSTATEEQLLAMLRNLLIDRFQLRFHIEKRQMPGFALGIGKNGSKLTESTSESPELSFGPSGKPRPGGPITLLARKQSMETLAGFLSQIEQDGPIVNKTGLAGLYDFRLDWDDGAGPSLSTALQEELGLRLIRTSEVPVSYFVFESASRPAGN